MGTPGKPGLRVVVKDLTYVVQSNSKKGERLTLLNNVTAMFTPGTMSAVMGPSGSGKTTLLDLLAGRKTVGEISGEILYDNNKPMKAFLRRHAGYVEQFDTLVDNLTVYEMLMYTAELKRPMQEQLASKKLAVEDLIQKLALGVCRDSKIGSILARGISGGQAKRVNVGIALITNPSVLYLDEPTSGLDSFTANEVMQVVKALVKDGKTICATIHAPSSITFALFDQVLLLASGRVVYYGPNHGPLISHFHVLCGAREPQVGDNLSDWIMEFTSMADRDGLAAMADRYENSALAASNRARIESDAFQQKQSHNLTVWDGLPDVDSDRPPSRQLPGSVSPARLDSVVRPEIRPVPKTSEYVTSPFWALRVLLQYRTMRNYKALDYMLPRILDKVIFGVAIVLLYSGSGDNFKPSNIPNIAALMYLCMAAPAWGAVSFLPGILMERPLYVRERNDGLYPPIVYLVFKLVDELLVAAVVGVGAWAIVFFGVQLQGNYGFFYITMLMLFSNSVAIAYGVATLCSTIDAANATVPTLVAIMFFYSGFLIRIPDMPVYVRWLTYPNVLRYGWAALMLNQFEDHPEAFVGGEPILHFFDLDQYDKWVHIGIMAAFFTGWCIMAWVGLTYVRLQRR